MANLKSLALVIALAAGSASAEDIPPIIAPPKPDVAADVPPCQPRSLISMTIRNVTPGLQAVDPRAQPKQLWRKGGRFLRSLEQPVVSAAIQDPKAPMARQALVIISEPDVWVIDQASREGRHTLDKGPVLEVRAPILQPGAAPQEFMSLEYGCEAEFVTVRAPMAQKTIRWGGVDAGIHTYTVGADSLAILMNDRTGEPLMITHVREGRPVYIVRYDAYLQGLPDQPDLFRPPADIKITTAEKAR
ncbi:MAG: hypothetical protein KKE02_24820 [Alphaproteobacteria bacterium]|nr:hypothetical protein [Alphaproteobacteria bacterium]MBU1513953.1 hypothetical protein [Alphaproteobacteria bacterium]MBU2092615.1 hypothetical protein [Alphaproteobacteria bacterium]MBU2154264.1 hypothetical protein [Alphaproteobacteria bacterium]MBU2309490.1 hypothetical protein [Alphaproteobacteria bacterium]